VRTTIAIAGLMLLAAGTTSAQTPLPGFGPDAAARQAAVERVLLEVPDTARARRHARALAAEPHVAGTPRQRWTADYVMREMAAMGLDTQRVALRVYLPHPESTVVELVAPERRRIALVEPPIPGDPSTQDTLWPPMNGYSGAGDVTAPVVYVNYGLAEDYRLLDSLGIPVRGRVAIARYGRSYRGIKAREAERNGAAALIMYSDPQDDGYFRGDVYPDGPWRGAHATQRGSINNSRADPSTPGWASTRDARRVPFDSMEIPRIPVVPMGYGHAAPILEALGGRSVPQAWQGGLPFRYHVGGTDSVRLRVAVWPEQGERAYKTIENTFGTLRGSDWRDELVVVGGHRDSWGHGAADNVSGIVSILEAARAWSEAAKRGMRPRRSIVFATWDAEEWGLVGSTEWVELAADRLRKNAVAYLNQDMSAVGRGFGASGTASLHPLLRAATGAVTHPGDSVTVAAAWRRGVTPPDTLPRIGDLGGGSDFAGFYNFLGIPAIDFGFGGPVGVYHSAYDTYTFMERFADPGYLSHAAAARLSAVLLGRIANADVVPLDYASFGSYLLPLLANAEKAAGDAGWKLETGDLRAALGELRTAGAAFNAARDAAVAARPSRKSLTEANRLLRGVEQEITRPEGLPGRANVRNLVFAADRDNGYANIPLPGLMEAIRDRDEPRAKREIADLARRVRAAAARVDAARTALAGR
jgi:N-acetylated-alpha-linked acidic dipeptidase